MNKKIYIPIEEITCDYVQYLNHKVNSYKEILTEVLSNKRAGLEISRELFDEYNNEYMKIYLEFQTLKDTIIEELFPIESRDRDVNYLYTINYMSKELIVETMEV